MAVSRAASAPTAPAGRIVTIEKRGRIAIVRFDRGDGRNPLSRAVMRELLAAARSFEDDLETSAIVLTGSERAFTVGYDLKDGETARQPELGLAERRHAVLLGPKMCKAWEDLAPLTICAVEGWCVGGGVALAAACDLRVAGAGATFYVPELERGMNMSWQSVPRMVALMGPARTKQLVVLAQRIAAAKAEAWGFVQEIADDGAALARAVAIAERVAELPPIPVRMAKQGINVAAHALAHATSFMDADQYALCVGSEDYAEGISSFLEKRPPVFRGR